MQCRRAGPNSSAAGDNVTAALHRETDLQYSTCAFTRYSLPVESSEGQSLTSGHVLKATDIKTLKKKKKRNPAANEMD